MTLLIVVGGIKLSRTGVTVVKMCERGQAYE
jgi:hypothetical protein